MQRFSTKSLLQINQDDSAGFIKLYKDGDVLGEKLGDLAFWSNKTQSDIYKAFPPFPAQSVFILKFLQTKWRNEFVWDADTAHSSGPVGCNTGSEDYYVLGF